MKLTSHNLPKSRKKYLELHYGCAKIRHYEEDDLKQLFKFMLALCKLAGVTEAPDKEIVMLLINHLQEHHKDFSKEEIQNAFSLAMAGKLDFEFKHYNRLTPQLISQTLNSYKAFRSKEINTYEEKLRIEEQEAEAARNKPTPEQRLENGINRAVEHFNQYRLELEKYPTVQQEITDWGGVRYDFLVNLGVINFNQEEKLEIKEKAMAQLISEKRKEGAKLAKDEFKQAMNSQDVKRAIAEIKGGQSPLVVSTAKQIALNRYYDFIIEMETDLGDLLKKALFEQEDPMYMEVAKKVL